MFEYGFTVASVHDGDTFSGTLDFGFEHDWTGQSVRMHGINAPELTLMVDGHKVLQQSGEDSTLHLMGLLGGRSLFAAKRTQPVFGTPGDYLVIGAAPRLVVKTHYPLISVPETEKYGRILAECYLRDDTLPDSKGLDLCAQMLADGFAEVLA